MTSLGEIADGGTNPLKRKRKSSHVHFNEDEEVINPGQCRSKGKIKNIYVIGSYMWFPQKEGRGKSSGYSGSVFIINYIQ